MSKDVIHVEDVVVREDTAKAFRGVNCQLGTDLDEKGRPKMDGLFSTSFLRGLIGYCIRQLDLAVRDGRHRSAFVEDHPFPNERRYRANLTNRREAEI